MWWKVKLARRYRGPLLALMALSAAFLQGCRTLPSLAVPVTDAPAHEYPEPPPAMIRIPVIVSLPVGTLGLKPAPDLLTGNLKEDIPRLLKGIGGMTYQLARDPLHWEASKDSFSTVMRLRYSVAQRAMGAAVKGGEKLQGYVPGIGVEKKAVIRAQKALEWSKDWHLESVTSFLALPGGVGPVKGTPQKIDELVQRTGEDFLSQKSLEFDRNLRILTDLKPHAAEIWSEIQEPIYLDQRIWLVIRPETVSVGQVRLNPLRPQKLETAFEMTARPQILFGETPVLDKRPLPPLIPYRKGPSGFHALSNVLISYPEATKFLRDKRVGILGQVIPGTGDRKLRIKGLRFYGSGGKVVAEIGLEYNPFPFNLGDKPARMTVYLTGKPRYLPAKRLFDLPDLDFDVKTNDFLVQVAQWIFKSDMRRMLRRKAKVPIGPKLDELSARLSTILNRPLGPHAQLNVRGVSLKVLDSFADNEGMKARVALDGDTELKVEWK